MSIPANLKLLLPAQMATRSVVSETARAFRMGPRIHPNRAAYEFYPTPPEATRALLSVERFDGSIWEPACGEGHIAKALTTAGYDVVSTDLVDYGFGMPERDFLAEREPLAKHIVTNPPYGKGLADAFVKHALKLTAKTSGNVAMLMALQSLCHPLRHDFWTQHAPAILYGLDDCTCWPYGDPSRATTTIAKQRYVWAVWKHAHSGPTEFRWLSTRAFKSDARLDALRELAS
jgi:hypothetical protein